MKITSYLFVLCALVSVSCSVFASNGTLAFTQSTDGVVSAVYNSGPCLLGLYPSQGVTPTVTINASQIVITSPSAVFSYFGSGEPPCDPQISSGYMLPAALGKLPDGHYPVIWSFYPGQLVGAFDVVSGLLVSAPGASLPIPAAVSGLWSDPGYSGEGFNFLMSNSGFLVTFYGWDDVGNRLWLTSDMGSTSIELNRPIVLNMTYTTGGVFSDPQHNLVQWGSLVLNFTSCKAALASLSGKDGTQNLNLTQLAGIAGLAPCECGARRLPLCYRHPPEIE